MEKLKKSKLFQILIGVSVLIVPGAIPVACSVLFYKIYRNFFKK